MSTAGDRRGDEQLLKGRRLDVSAERVLFALGANLVRFSVRAGRGCDGKGQLRKEAKRNSS